MLILRATAFGLPKQGNAEEEYEDAWALAPSSRRFAVADGATESIFARLWAEILARTFVQVRPRRGFREWLHQAQKQWCQAVPWTNLPWYAEEKARTGSFSTFAGLWMTQRQSCRWNAVVMGDCCLFHVRSRELLRAFPLSRSEEFGNRPELLRSVGMTPEETVRQLQSARGTLEPADLFILATDAVAQWCLRSLESGELPWIPIEDLSSPEDFHALVTDLRCRHEIRNDDSTLIRIVVSDGVADGR